MRTTRCNACVSGVLVGAVFSCAPGSVDTLSTRADASDAPTYILPPVIDASFSPDSLEARERAPFPCGTVSGSVTASLTCELLYFGWDYDSGHADLSIRASVAGATEGADAAASSLIEEGLVFAILTRPPRAPMKESCATLPPLPPDVWVAVEGGFGAWTVACNSATEVVPGSSFELSIISVGVLRAPPLGLDALDASADGFDWDGAADGIQTNTFHGTLTATLVASDAGLPVYVSMTF